MIYDLGAYGMSFEWTRAETEYAGATGDVTGDQLAISAIYRF